MIESLKNLPLFNEVNLSLLDKLVSNSEIIKRSYNKGSTIHEQHTECYGIDIVSTGKLISYSLSSGGSETFIFEFSENSIIGANLLFGKENKYPMNIYCTSDCILFHVSKSAVIKLLREYSFVMQFIKSLSLNSQGMNKKIAMYTQKSLRENLVDYFTVLSEVQKSKTIILPISKKQLADHLGVQRPSLFRELKRMKDEGLLKIENRKITIYD